MNPSSLRISARRTLSREEGMSTFSCSASPPFRIRASMSATGSVTIAISALPPRISPASPRGLDHARDLAPQGQAPEADPAQLELAEIAPRTPADSTARVAPGLELGGSLLLEDQRRLRHTGPLYSRKGTPRCWRRALASSS